jgi:hypothetical protein
MVIQEKRAYSRVQPPTIMQEFDLELCECVHAVHN